MKKILVVSHCILNTAAKVAQDESGLAEEYQKKAELMKLVFEQGIQLLQLPCPEFYLYGSRRWGHVKDQFQHPHFRKECARMLEPILMQLEEYMKYPEEFEVLGIVSVDGSPSCGYGLTCRSEQWYGEFEGADHTMEKIDTVRMTREPGVLMEILEHDLKEYGLNISIMNLDDIIQKLGKN